MKHFFALLSAFVLCTGAFAQVRLDNAQKESLATTWYENEAAGDTVTFRTRRHIHVPGKDDPSVVFSTITFHPANDFVVEAWRWCSKSKFVFDGKWNLQPGPVIRLDFGKQKCKCQLTVLSLEKDRLRVLIKEQ